ncbi:hypothetical protein Pst134EB_001256 [Puccinia striiformis f. sp. tritici]|nr:hypothetical protein Pst134EB_001256 [Puccinia striiformis f. sp. tritici]
MHIYSYSLVFGLLQSSLDQLQNGLSERTHDATSVHTARGTDVQSALEGQQSERRDLQDGTVQRNRLERYGDPSNTMEFR